MPISTVIDPPRDKTLADTLHDIVDFANGSTAEFSKNRSRLVQAVVAGLARDRASAIAGAVNAKKAALVTAREAFIESGNVTTYQAASASIEAQHTAAVAEIVTTVSGQLAGFQADIQKAVAGFSAMAQSILADVEDAVKAAA